MLPIQKETVSDIVMRYNRAIEAMEDLNAVSIECHKIFKEFDGYGFYMTFENHVNFEQSKKKATRAVWHEILNKTGIREAITEQRKKELDGTIDSDRMPAVTVENVYNILDQLYNRAPELLNEFVISCYNMFIPGKWDKLKTNKDGEIKKRGILKGIFDCFYTFSVHFYGLGFERLKTLENTFSLLDGKGIVTNKEQQLYNLINDKIKAGEKTLETEYFKLKWFTNDHLHVEFKRLDLLQQLNAIGAKNRLKQTA